MLRTLASFCIFALALGLAIAPVTAFAEKKKENPKLPKPPPLPVSQTVSVARGESIEIRLSIFGRKNENLKFLIRTKPEHGKLTDPVVVAQEASTVTYKSPSDLGVKRERFTYSVQNVDGVSAPVDVMIDITDQAATLVIPDRIDYDPVLAGKAAMKEFEVKNIGGSLSEGEVQVFAPWRIEGPVAYKLGAGKTQKFILFFEPRQAGVFRGEMRFTSQLDRSTLLRATGDAAIGVSPADVVLQQVVASPLRTGRVELVNNTQTEQAITVSSEKNRVQVTPAKVAIPAGGRATLSLATVEGEITAVEDQLSLRDETGVDVKVPVHSLAAGPVLRVTQTIFRLPSAPRGQSATASLAIENVGGRDGFWKWQPQPPFTTDPGSAHLQAGAKAEIRVTLAASEPGVYRGIVKIEGEQQTSEVQLEGEIVSPVPMPAKTGAATKRPVAGSAGSATGETLSNSAIDAEQSQRIASLLYLRDNIHVKGITSTSATMEWPVALTSASDCRVEVRNMRLDDKGNLRPEWAQTAGTKVTRLREVFSADLRNLHPAAQQTIRVVTVPGEGETATVLFQTQFATMAPAESPFRLTLGRTIVFLLVVVAVIAYARQRVLRSREEALLAEETRTVIPMPYRRLDE